MAGFSTVAQVAAAAITQSVSLQKIPWLKKLPATSVANILNSFWQGAGLPGAGSLPTSGVGNGRVCTSSTTGALPMVNAPTNETLHLVSFEAGVSSVSTVYGGILLVDRICDVQLAHNEPTNTITGCTATSRLPAASAAEAGGLIFCEVTSAFSGASNTLTFGYTNQDGNAATSGNVVTVASAAQGRTISNDFFVPLASGDSGARAITSVTLVSGSATGSFLATIVRPLCYLPTFGAQNMEKDCALETVAMDRIYDASCLSFLSFSNSAVQYLAGGTVKLVSR